MIKIGIFPNGCVTLHLNEPINTTTPCKDGSEKVHKILILKYHYIKQGVFKAMKNLPYCDCKSTHSGKRNHKL